MAEYSNQSQLIGGTEATEDAQKDKCGHKSLEICYKNHCFKSLKIMYERTYTSLAAGHWQNKLIYFN